jgi:hypothetical protein
LPLARVPLIFGPGHGRTFTMDLDALKLQRTFIFYDGYGVTFVEEDSDPQATIIEAMRDERTKYHLYDRKVWVGLGVDNKEFVLLEHSENCQCQPGN